MKENKEFNVQDRHIYSLVSILLLAPLVYFMVNSKDFDITDKDKLFISGYIKYWIIVLLLVVLWWVSSIISFSTNFLPFIFEALSSFAIWAALIMILVGFFLIFQDKFILQGNIDVKYKKINTSTIDIVFCYIPIYNIHLWYSDNLETRLSRWVKESILLWTFWSALSLITLNPFLSFFIFAIIILRVTSLWAGVDFIPDKRKESIDGLFETNPEEIFAYIKWTLLFVAQKIKNNKIWQSVFYNNIQDWKQEYGYITNIQSYDKQNFLQNKNIMIQYILFILLAVFLFQYLLVAMRYSLYWNIFLLALLFLFLRYIYMLYIKKLLKIPLINELVALVSMLLGFLQNKSKKWKE